MNPLISVIVPVYNVERYLNQCIDSILAQTYKNFELILVDDGSKDKSGQICDEYAQQDNRVRVFHKENGGVSSARNLGIDNAQGTHICFVDSDDWVEMTYLEDMILHKDYDFVVQDFETEDGKYIDHLELKINNTSDIYRELINYEKKHDILFRAPSSKLYNTNILRENNLRYNISLYMGEDYLFNINYISHINNTFISNGHSYIYRKTIGSLTHKPMPSEDIFFHAKTFILTAKRISEKFDIPDLYNLILGEQIENLFRKFYRTKRRKEERRKAFLFFKENFKSGMLSYMNVPYSKFGPFKNISFKIADKVLLLLFAIMEKIKPAPQF